MQVILVKPVRKLGKVGETVNVANGYGRNFLVPQDFAIRATKENIEKFVSIQKDLEKKNDESKIEAEKASKTIEGKHVTFITQSAADGRLFGSVTAKTLALEVSKLAEVSLNYNNILLDNPIKFNGVYDVQIVLHPEVVTNVLVVVAKSTPEAQDALKEFKAGPKEDELQEEELAELAAAAAAAELESEVEEATEDQNESQE